MLPLGISSSKDIDFLSALQYSPIPTYNSIGFSTALHNSTGNIYLYGWSGYTPGATGAANHIVAKYNKHGILQWQKNYNSANFGFRSEFAIDLNENIFVSDVFTASGVSGKLHTLFKMNQSGTVVWARNFYENASDNPLPTATAVSADGSYIYTAGHIGAYGYYVKYDSSGIPLVAKKLTANTNILNSHMCIDSNNNVFLVVGQASKMTLAKYTADGTLSWQRQITSLIPYDITCDSAGNPHIAGYRYDPDPGDPTVALNGEGHIVKYNSSGVLQWQKKINLNPQGAYDTSFFSGIRVGSDGSIYANLVATDLFSYPPSNLGALGPNTYAALMKFDSSGNYNWSKTYKVNSGNSFASNKISIDINNKIYISSSLVSGFNSSGFSQYGIIKIDPKSEINDKNVILYNPVYFSFNKDGLGYYSYTAVNSSQTESAGSLTSSNAAFTHLEVTNLQSTFVNSTINTLFTKTI